VAVSDTHSAISIFITLLLIASDVAMLRKWVRVPYTLALVAVGLIISPLHFLPPVHFSPDLILLIFLPALLFEAAWNLKIAHLRANLVPILTLAVYGLLLPINFFTEPISWRWRHVLFWGGLRGSLSVALALSLPAALPFRAHLVAMTFGTVIFSLLVQGLTISPLLGRLGIKQGKPGAEVG
jgi:monovalent cation:H+ antiporter, CPA1 family